MILKSLEIKNVRSYRNEKISFPKGITLFQGDVGSGKSSILMAIEFALFGLGSQDARGLLSTKKNEASAKLEFEINDNNYEIFRSLKKKNSSIKQNSGYIKINDIKENLSITELKKRIIQILKFNEPYDAKSSSRIFRYAIYTPQEQMKIILNDSEKRLEFLRRAFEIESYKIAVENASLLAHELDKISNKFESKSKELDGLEKKFFEIRKEISIFQKNLSNYNKKSIDFDTQKLKLVKDLTNLKQKEKKFLRLEEQVRFEKQEIIKTESILVDKQNELRLENKELVEINTTLNRLKTITKPTSKSLKQISDKINQFREVEKLLNSANSQVENLSINVTELSSQLGNLKKSSPESLQKQIQAIKNTLKSQKNILENHIKSHKQLQKNETLLTDKIKNLQTNLENSSKLGGKCPVCEQILDEKHINNLVSERKKELTKTKGNLTNLIPNLKLCTKNIEQLNSDIKNQESTITQLNSMAPLLDDLVKKKKSLDEFKKQNITLQSKFRITDKEITKLQEKFSDPIEYYLFLKDKLIQYNHEKEQIVTLTNEWKKRGLKITNLNKNIIKIQNELSDHKNTAQIIKQKIDSMRTLPVGISKCTQAISKIENEISQFNKIIFTQEANKSNSEKRMKELQNEISISQEAKAKYDKCLNYFEWDKNYFIPSVEVIEKQFMQYLQQDFNQIYHNWYSLLIDDPSKESRIDEDFSPIIEQEGIEQNLEYLSGGEKTSIALAYRLTLNTMLKREMENVKSSLLILDEPTDGFSKTQLTKVRTILKGLESEQIILVSHEKELEDYVDHVFHVAKYNGLSEIS